VRYVPDGSLCTASAEQIFPRDSVQRNCFELALYTTRDHDCISNRIRSGIRNCPRCRCRLATFAALPTPSMIERAIIMLTDHRFWGHASGPSSSGKTLPSFYPLLARPCRSPQRPTARAVSFFDPLRTSRRSDFSQRKLSAAPYFARRHLLF
jgi:hypothetical protein